MVRCLHCFTEYDESLGVCPRCHKEQAVEPIEPIHLYPGTILNNRYIIGTSVGSGGFGVIYRAFDTKLQTVIAVKEFFVSRITSRAIGEKKVIISKKGKDEFEYRKARFVDEARTMAEFNGNRSIPNVYEVFEENDTAYFVMELLEGETLNEYLKKQPGNKLDQDLALYITEQIGNALSALHKKGIIHRDVAPDNIFICSNSKDVRIVLLDLGAAKLQDGNEEVTDIILKPGYSPAEQYDTSASENKSVRPAMDVYALAATTYVMLTGHRPDESTNRKKEDTVKYPHQMDSGIPENISNAVMRGMAVEKHLRFQSVQEYLTALRGTKKVLSVEKEKVRRRRRRVSWVVIAAALLVIAGLFVFRVYQSYYPTLRPTNLEVWISIPDDTDQEVYGNEEEAFQAVISEFQKTYPKVTFTVTAIPASEYEERLLEAKEKGKLPDLYESTDVSQEILDASQDLSKVLSSRYAKKCYFLDQYASVYSEVKKIPYAVDPGVLCVIKSEEIEENGKTVMRDQKLENVSINSVEELGKTDDFVYYIDNKNQKFVETDFSSMTFDETKDYESFIENENDDEKADDAAILATKVSRLNDIYSRVQTRRTNYIYLDDGSVDAEYTYEWSVGSKSSVKKDAAIQFLSMLLDNTCQHILLIDQYHPSVIPVNKDTFADRISDSTDDMLLGIKDVYTNIHVKK